MNKIRKGDEVLVITGKDKGKRGIVLLVGEDRVTVEGINLVKEHVKAEPDEGYDGWRRSQDDALAYFERRIGRREWQGVACGHQGRERQEGTLLEVDRCRAGRLTRSNKWLVCMSFYKEKVVPGLIEKFGYKSVMEVPRITKITLNMGLGEAVADKKIIENAVGDLTKIAGQKPVITKARKAIAGFKIRQGYPIGAMVTLRGQAMYEFLDRFVTVALPRVRRLPRRIGSCVRWSRQLQHRCERDR